MSLYKELVDNIQELFDSDDVKKDNVVNKLYYKVTALSLAGASVILSLQQYVGDPIDCHTDLPRDKYADTFCFVEGTYTKRPTENDPLLGSSGSIEHMKCEKTDDKTCWHHLYYQWVGLLLIFQAGCFYFPRYLWTIWEHGKIKSFVTGLDKQAMIKGLQTEEDFKEGDEASKLNALVKNYRDTRGQHDGWAIKYYLVELANFINIFIQFYLVNVFLDHEFHNVAVGGLRADIHESVLPIVAECRYKETGSGGGGASDSILCVLPNNMFNQKVFTIFFVWLGVLLIASLLLFIVRIFLVSSTLFREIYVKWFYNLSSLSRDVVNMDDILKKTSHGDFLLLTFLFDNMNSIVSREFVKKCANEDWNDQVDKFY